MIRLRQASLAARLDAPLQENRTKPVLSGELGRSKQELTEEALRDFLAKHGREVLPQLDM